MSSNRYPRTFSGRKSVQVESELRRFLELIKSEGVTSYLEVGVGRGDTFHEVVSSLPKGSRAVAVDLPASSWGFEDSRQQLQAVIDDLCANYDVRVIFGDSKAPEVIASAAGKYDCVFIDGDHSYEGVRSDYLNYGPMGRIVAFHDISFEKNHSEPWGGIDVKRFWNELKLGRNTVELVERDGNMGIGVLYA
jgi:predicted O-methyltransferase YrrM